MCTIAPREQTKYIRIASSIVHNLCWILFASITIEMWDKVWHRLPFNCNNCVDRMRTIESVSTLKMYTRPNIRTAFYSRFFSRTLFPWKNTIYSMHFIIFDWQCDSVADLHFEKSLIFINYLSFFGNCQSHDCNVLLKKNVVTAKRTQNGHDGIAIKLTGWFVAPSGCSHTRDRNVTVAISMFPCTDCSPHAQSLCVVSVIDFRFLQFFSLQPMRCGYFNCFFQMFYER